MRVVILDGNNNFIRQYVANPTMDVNGEPVGGTVGTLRNVRSYLRDMKPDRLIVVWDGEGGSQKRRSVYSEYKAGRKVRLNREFESADGAREDLGNMLRQFELVQKYLRLLGICQVRVDNVEADDVISLIVGHMLDETDEKVIVTSDNDMLQLVGGTCRIFNPLKKEYYSTEHVVKKHGALPENYIFTKAFCGDASDNVKGIRGIGEKTMTKLFPMIAERKTTLDELFAHANDNLAKSPKYKTVLESREKIVENMKLMQLALPVISAQSARSIRHQLDSKHGSLNTFDAQLAFMKDGLQLKDIDFFGPFKEYSIRRKYGKLKEEKHGE